MTRSIERRALLLALGAASLAAACARRGATDRCELCGMKIDPTSAWRAELVGADGKLHAFDTPRCALAAWRRGKVPATALRVQEFYDRTWVDGASVRFVVGGDVVGPMGPDLVPVDAARAAKFVKDHGAERALELADVRTEILDALN